MKTRYTSFLLSFLLLTMVQVRAQHLPKGLAPHRSRWAVGGAVGVAERPSGTAVLRARQAVRYTWDAATSAWAAPQREVLSFDTKARLSELVASDSATAVPTARTLYVYDAANHVLERVMQTPVGTSWLNDVRLLSTFDSQGMLVEEQTQKWISGRWQTEEGFRYQNSYSNGVVQEQVVQRLTQGSYQNESRFQYTLLNGRWSEVLAQRWTQNAWLNEERTVALTWHNWEARQLSAYRVQNWQPTGQWLDFQRGTLTYSPTGTSITVIESGTTGGGWQNFLRLTLPLDAQGNSTGYREEEWRNGIWTLTTELREQLRYDANNQLTRRTQQVYSPISAHFTNAQRTNYSHFQNVVTATFARQASERLQLYPVPALASAVLECPGLPDQNLVQVEVVSLTGRVVWSTTAMVRQGVLRTQLDLRTVAPGMYLVRIPMGQGAVVRQFSHL